jgi:hypothetical protein
MKTDNPNEVGVHVFERAGLGLAPFRVYDFMTITYQACPGAPVQPGGSCDYCGTGIMYACLIQSSDGKRFKVGCDCVNKTGDKGIIQAYKKSAAYRDHQRQLRNAQYLVKHEKAQALLAFPEIRSELQSKPHPNSYFAAKGKTLLDYYEFMNGNGPTNTAWILKKLELLFNRPK